MKETGRIDAVLSRMLPFSRNRVQQWIKQGRVRRDGETITDKSTGVEPGQRIVVNVPEPSRPQKIQPEDEPLEVLYEDDEMIALNKPAGIVVHPAGAHQTGTLVHRLLHHFPDLRRVGPEGRAGLVHRLDRGTSGVVLVARNNRVLDTLQDQFRRRDVKKVYRALLTGVLEDARVTIEVPVGRHPGNPTLRKARPTGKYALTRIERVDSSESVTAVWCYPETGRTHQIRIHCQYIDHPILGDRKYGGAEAPRLMLHAERLEFNHPTTGEKRVLEAPCPEDLMSIWNRVVKRTNS